MTRANTLESLWERVERGGPDECWPCALRPNTSGHRQMQVRGKAILAHRIAFFLTHGRWPEPCCLHRCDNPACCNPAHLFEGTQADNIADMMSKGRHNPAGLSVANARPRHGELNPNCKLTDEQVRELRALVLAKVPRKDLSARYGVTLPHICRILAGKERSAA